MGGVTACLEVVDAGPASSFQDAGRFGFVSYGVAPAGPCDPLLHAIANGLVGNPADAATIEYTLRGDTYKVSASSCRIAIAGDFLIEIDGQRVDAWRAHTLYKGQTLSVLYASQGVRGYIAVAGGFALDPVLGSVSTHARSGIGPLGGGTLKSGDRVPLALSDVTPDGEMEFDRSALPALTSEVRVVLGPQVEHFSDADIDALRDGLFTVTPQSDRMGCRLDGPVINYRKDRPLISEGIALGSIQAPGEGLFIVALYDRQTVGGYPKIATAISADIREITQARQGARLRFRAIDVVEAQRHARTRKALIDSIRDHIRPVSVFDMSSERLLSLNLISGVYAA